MLTCSKHACIHAALSHYQALCCLSPCRVDHVYVSIEGVLAVHATVIIAANRHEARSELGTVL